MLLNQCLEEVERAFGPRSVWTAICLAQVGAAYYLDGEYSRAIKSLERAIDIRDSLEVTAQNSQALASIMADLAECYW
jgi:tetratricopeptide (TPR) repeat protein